MVPIEAGRFLANNIIDAEFVELENVGHNFFLHESDMALKKVFSFTNV